MNNSPQNCKYFPPKAKFPGKEIPKFHIYSMHGGEDLFMLNQELKSISNCRTSNSYSLALNSIMNSPLHLTHTPHAYTYRWSWKLTSPFLFFPLKIPSSPPIHIICDMIKGNESLVGNIQFWVFNIIYLHISSPTFWSIYPITIRHLVQEIWAILWISKQCKT